jgi:hypothetical protein
LPEDLWQHIVCKVVHKLIGGLKSLAAPTTPRYDNPAATQRNRYAIANERIEAVFHELRFCRLQDLRLNCFVHFVRVAFSYTLIAILPMKRTQKIFLALAAAAIILAILVFLATVASDPLVAFRD